MNIVKKYKVLGLSFEIDRIKLTGKSEESVTMKYSTLWTFRYYRAMPFVIIFNIMLVNSSAGSRPKDKGGGGGGLQIFRPLGPQFGPKIRGARTPPGPSPGSATE